MNNPTPIPVADLPVNLSKIVGSSSGTIPLPESVIVTVASLVNEFFSAVKVIVPFSVNFIALFNKLEIT
jgi:hypothetical protein